MRGVFLRNEPSAITAQKSSASLESTAASELTRMSLTGQRLIEVRSPTSTIVIIITEVGCGPRILGVCVHGLLHGVL